MLGTLIRAGDVLDLFTLEEPEWGVTAAAARLGIGKSLAHEALATLAEIGLLRRVARGRYRLGWRTISLASVLMQSSGLAACAKPVVRRLAQSRGVAVSVVAWERDRLLYVNCRRPAANLAAAHRAAVVPAESLVSAPRRAGELAPIDGSAAARVLLASRPQAEVKALWEGGCVHTRHATLDALAGDLAAIRGQGWAADASTGDREPGHEAASSAGVAAPIRDPDGGVAAAICLISPGPPGELEIRRTALLAVAAATRISQALRAAGAAA